MKIALLGNINAIHTQRWIAGLSERGHEVHSITAHYPSKTSSQADMVHVLPFRPKSGYYLNAFFLRRLLNRLNPDITHVHYASGYGTLMRVCGYRPYILSVWGSDVFEYPDQNRFSWNRVHKNIKKAAEVCSTSHMMARRTEELCPDLTEVHITPFGVDTEKFSPANSKNDASVITIGTVKKLTPKYGIDVLIRAFCAARDKLAIGEPELSRRLRLRIVGGGPDEKMLKRMADQLGISAITEFTGAVEYSKVPQELQRLDVYAAVSRYDSETFGVAIVEASACEVPVIVSNKGGLPEVVVHGETGLIVPAEDVERTAEAMIQLVKNPQRRKEMGIAGRRFVLDKYDWQVSVDIMEEVYRKFLEKHR